jgi:hypothetical protein
MVKIPGYDFDSDDFNKIANLAGSVVPELFEAQLNAGKLLSFIGPMRRNGDEQQMFELVVEALYHINTARRCIDKLCEGIEETFEENDLAFGVKFHPQCDDCGVNTDPTDGIPTDTTPEYYMVQNELWVQARKQPVNGKSELLVTATLCIGCLEARLGKKLVPADFQYTIGKRSARLEDRARGVGDRMDPVT